MSASIRLKTPRLVLREFTADDAGEIWSFSQSPEHRQYEPDAPKSLIEFQGIVEWIIQQRREVPRKFHYLVVCLPDVEATAIGSLHLTIHSRRHRQAEIGYTFGVPYWGKGYATEAARAMLTFAFTTVKMWRVTAADIISENTGSIRVAEKLGMRREATFRDAVFFNDRWWDTCTYAIRRPEWEMTLP